MIKKILFITLSNIGDVILTLPALDRLREDFPHAKITCLVGPRPREIFENNPFIDRLIIFDKHAGLIKNLKLLRELKGENFDIVVDLRNSFFGLLLPAKYKIPHLLHIPRNLRHMKDRHLYKVNKAIAQTGVKGPSDIRETSLFIGQEDKLRVNNLLTNSGIKPSSRLVVVSVGARSHIKRWPKEKFAELIFLLIKELAVSVVLVGDKNDSPIADYITKHCGYPLCDLCGRTNLAELANLLQRANLLITNDSAALHMGSYMNLPVLAVFGSTNEKKYGPWSDYSFLAKKEVFCRPCEKAQCRLGTLNCITAVKARDLVVVAKRMLGVSGNFLEESPGVPVAKKIHLKRILITRTDRIGDVVLSTPVIKALRDAYPHAYIAMIVAPSARDIVDGNPYLDEVIIYDKFAKHKSWYNSMKFARVLAKKRFDVAVILHPTNRMHLVTFFAGIKRRVGWNRKLGGLLTERVRHLKQFGQKHELDYSLDLLRHLGIEARDRQLHMPIKETSEAWIRELLRGEKVSAKDKILVIHPGASCPSKVWDADRFSEAADSLSKRYGLKVIIVAGPKDTALAARVTRRMHVRAIDLAGMTSVSQLASVLKRASLFISNDSGPVHIGSAVGVPVISIFGRAQRGLSPKRWGPVGNKGYFLHKDVGCSRCLAHNCSKGFECLKAVTVEDVLKIAEGIL